MKYSVKTDKGVAVGFLAGSRMGPTLLLLSLFEVWLSLRPVPSKPLDPPTLPPTLPLTLPPPLALLEGVPYRCTWMGKGEDRETDREGELDGCWGWVESASHGHPAGEWRFCHIFSVGGRRPLSLTSSEGVQGGTGEGYMSCTAASLPLDLLRGRRVWIPLDPPAPPTPLDP
jgi:hypothetical protein